MVLKNLSLEVEEILMMEDNQVAQHLAESKALTQRSRHINTKYHWLREKVTLHESSLSNFAMISVFVEWEYWDVQATN
ncbi:hypothetical protein PHMEG_00037590 [Phytophthora megakarya]|uniref:Uncharacterized protein n=1 Tax=Phytophthora megakarya TaxID=4795 RepID=A0A225ULV8_9STRA|nr:hypothetical protein PHMEG_00037590 [Phytophthora megakarya]